MNIFCTSLAHLRQLAHSYHVSEFNCLLGEDQMILIMGFVWGRWDNLTYYHDPGSHKHTPIFISDMLQGIELGIQALCVELEFQESNL